MNTLTLEFADAQDLAYVLKYIARAKEQDGTVTGVYNGLMCSALKRCRVVDGGMSPDEIKNAIIGKVGA